MVTERTDYGFMKDDGQDSLLRIVRDFFNQTVSLKTLLLAGTVTAAAGFAGGYLLAPKDNPFKDPKPKQVYVDRDGDGVMDMRLEESYDDVVRDLRDYRAMPRRTK